MNLKDLFIHYRYLTIWVLALVTLITTIYWGRFYNRTKVIRIATASKGGYYYQFGIAVKKQIELETKYTVKLLTTAGSVENRSLLLAKKADFAIIQGGAASLKNLTLVRPLWHDYIQIIVRKSSKIQSLKDLNNRQVALGGLGSGYRSNAVKLLNYFSLPPKNFLQNDVYFKNILSNPKIQAAIVTTNVLNPDIQTVMQTGLFDLLPLKANKGFSLYYPNFQATTIQAGSYITKTGPVPFEDVPTARTSANLIAPQASPPYMVKVMVEALQSQGLRTAIPVLIRPSELKMILQNVPMHPAMEKQLEPNRSFNDLARLVDFLASYHWLILVLLLLAVSTGYIWRVQQKSLTVQQDDELRKKLELGLLEIMNINNQQQAASNHEILKKYLLEVHEIKQQILEEILGTPAELSPLMSTFLQESTGLLRQIEWKITLGN